MNSLDTDQKIVQELRNRELLFHQAELCSNRELLEAYTSRDFWEVGASGTMYTREEVLNIVEKRFKEHTEPDTSNWEVSQFICRQIGENIYMVTYLLSQENRLSRRLTLWKNLDSGWHVLYHQGTLVQNNGNS